MSHKYVCAGLLAVCPIKSSNCMEELNNCWCFSIVTWWIVVAGQWKSFDLSLWTVTDGEGFAKADACYFSSVNEDLKLERNRLISDLSTMKKRNAAIVQEFDELYSSEETQKTHEQRSVITRCCSMRSVSLRKNFVLIFSFIVTFSPDFIFCFQILHLFAWDDEFPVETEFYLIICRGTVTLLHSVIFMWENCFA